MEYLKLIEEQQHIEKQTKFQRQNEKVTIMNCKDEIVYIKVGCCDSYYGTVNFEKTSVTNGGLGNLFKGLLTGDTLHLMKATVKGYSSIFISDSDHGLVPTGRSLFNFQLGKETLIVNASHLLAFEESVKWEVKVNSSFSHYVQGGLGNIHLTGPGWVTISCFGDHVVHKVQKNMPLSALPHAVVCWTSNLGVKVKTDITLGNLFGRSSGETVQLEFLGDGYVVVQSGHHPIVVEQHK